MMLLLGLLEWIITYPVLATLLVGGMAGAWMFWQVLRKDYLDYLLRRLVPRPADAGSALRRLTGIV